MTRDRNGWAQALALELAPAALFNFAVAFAVATSMRQSGLDELAAAASVTAGIAAFLLAWLGLRNLGRPGRRFALPLFDHPPVEAEFSDELLLTERVPAGVAAQQYTEDELLLDDVLQSLGPDARVVRLFRPNGIPTAGELQARIDRHLRSNSPPVELPDATQELHEAILALRQSLR